MPRSPLFKPEYATRWATYDVKAANKLLDEIGLTKKGSDGIRLLPNGQPAMFVVEHSSEKADEVDNMTLVIDQWKKIGIKALLKPQTTDNFRLRTTSGEAIMTAYAGVTTAAPTVETSPREFTPVMQGGLQWPKWGLFVESKGKQGEPCDMEVGKKLLEMLAEVGAVGGRCRTPQGLGRHPDGERRGGLLDRHGERGAPAGDAWCSNVPAGRATGPGIRADTSGSTSPTRSGWSDSWRSRMVR